MPKIKLIDDTEEEIILNEVTREHFNDPYNYTKEILDQFNNQQYYQPFISRSDNSFLDIGTNIGLFSLHISPYAKQLFCVEPTPSHMVKAKEILKNVPNVTFVEAALAGSTGEKNFYWCGINTTMNSLHQRWDKSFKVKTFTFPDLINHLGIDHIDFCKIDIEGSEDQAITPETVAPIYPIIDKIFIEVHPPTQEYQRIFGNIFRSAGYKVFEHFHDSLFCTK